MNPFDLQIQTTASDGKHTPRACVAMAKQNGVHTIAITDHDTVAGVPEALAAGRELGVRVIPGVEISLHEHGTHLLGLGIDIQDRSLLDVLRQAAANRLDAAKQMVENFQRDGFAVDWEDVLDEAGGSSVITRPHIVSAIMKRPENSSKLEGISTKHDFFQKYFTDTGPYYVRASQINPREAIGLVHQAGGVAVWSHPPVPDFVGKCGELGAFLKELIACGLDGLELFGPSLSDADAACLAALAGRYQLLVTAGSDFHEALPPTDKPWPRSATAIGEYPTYGRSLEGMLERFDAAMAERRRPVAGRG